MLVNYAWLVAFTGLLGSNSAALALTIPDQQPGSHQETQRNANHIFNAIHSSMRQFGSSLNYNGVSFFRATVPRGTRFYHGDHGKDPIIGMEWLAFEPEHAILFAQGHAARPPPRKGTPPPGLFPREHHSSSAIEPPQNFDGQPRFIDDEPPPEIPEVEQGWLHTYETNKDLKLIYLDGMSAAKCDLGTLDTQDSVLLNISEGDIPYYMDYERAKGLCKLAQGDWSNQVDGFIRMEAGFEIILCSFEDNLDLVDLTRPQKVYRDERFMAGPFFWYKAITARYFGIGGNRASIDYSDFVTGFNQPVDLFNGQDTPRIANASASILEAMKDNVTALVSRWKPIEPSAPNWQSIADMVVNRYANTLQYLVSESMSNKTTMNNELRRTLYVFNSSEDQGTTPMVRRCVGQFIPRDYNSSLAGRAIHVISEKICTTLVAATEEEDFNTATRSIKDLINYLNWTTWKECKGCKLGEICYVPIWPIGDMEDHSLPQCKNATAIEEGRRFGRRPGKPPGRPGEMEMDEKFGNEHHEAHATDCEDEQEGEHEGQKHKNSRGKGRHHKKPPPKGKNYRPKDKKEKGKHPGPWMV